MKFVLMAVAAVLLLGTGAAGAYFFLDKPAVAAGGPADEAKKAEHEAKKAEAEKAKTEVEASQFVRLETLNLPIIDEHGVAQVISLVVSIEVPDNEAAGEVKRLTPRLQDAFIQDMYGVLNRKNAMQNGVVQVDAIKERLNKVSVRVLGKDRVSSVLLQVVQQRSL